MKVKTEQVKSNWEEVKVKIITRFTFLEDYIIIKAIAGLIIMYTIIYIIYG